MARSKRRTRDQYANAPLAPRKPPPQCEECRKHTYDTLAAVQAAVTAVERRTHKPYEEYPCPAGTGWHITSNVTRGSA